MKHFKFYISFICMALLTAATFGKDNRHSVIANTNSEDVWLKELDISTGTLSPIFDPSIFDYTLQVDASVSSTDITGIAAISGATVTGNVTALPLKLNDFTDVTITVTNANGDKQNYTIAVIRGNIPPVSFTYQVLDDAVGQEINTFVGLEYGESAVIDWGDGTQDTVTDYWEYGVRIPAYGIEEKGKYILHTYSAAGSYEVTISGKDDFFCPLINLWTNIEEDFMAAKENVYVTSADVRKATSLLTLFVSNSSSLPHDNAQYIKRLDISHNRKLYYVECSNNKITELDISSLSGLTRLNCRDNQLITLDVSKNKTFTNLDCTNNQLTDIDLSNNQSLTELICTNNQLSNLDVNNDTALMVLMCDQNKLTNLDITTNRALTTLECSLNQLSVLDVSKNLLMTNLDCGSNQLTDLDVSRNTTLTLLSCLENHLTDLDVRKNTALTTLMCQSNQLINLVLSANTTLTVLQCYMNQLINLDVSNNMALASLNCSSNQLTDLNLNNDTSLTSLDCSSNQLSNLDVSSNKTLASLICGMNKFIDLDVSNCTLLTQLDCWYNQLTDLNLNNNTSLTSLDCSNNQLTNLDISNNTALNDLYCNANAIPLINFYTLAQQAGNITNKYLGWQYLPDSTVFVNTPVSVDTVFYGVNTACSYPLNNGNITFDTPGDYTVIISNPALLDGVVQQTFHVVEQGTGINNIPQEKPLNAYMQNGTLHVSGLPAGKSWSVYNASGSLVYQSIANSEEANIALSARGVYVVQSGNKTVKVIY